MSQSVAVDPGRSCKYALLFTFFDGKWVQSRFIGNQQWQTFVIYKAVTKRISESGYNARVSRAPPADPERSLR